LTGASPKKIEEGKASVIAQLLITISAAIIMLLGLLHLAFTYFGNKFHPRDNDLLARLKTTSPVISRQTSMWKAWIGFNASHSLGAILFGVVFSYLALRQPALLFHSWVLGLTGLVVLGAYLAMATLYWFSRPLQGISLAFVCYGAGFIVAHLHGVA
jgi:xanthosine utilization system XapX-like protein